MRYFKKIVKYVLFGLLGIVVLLLIWGVVVEPRLIDEKRVTAAIPRLPTDWEGKSVALIADLQIGMWLNNTDTIRRVVERLIEERPAAVLIAGDFIYKPTGTDEKEETIDEYDADEQAEVSEKIGETVEIIQRLTNAGIPVFAVFGNHDYAMMTPKDVKLEPVAQKLKSELTAAGVRVLENEAVPLPLGNGAEAQPGTLYLVGVGSKYAGHSRPAEALSQLPADAPRIALMHNPKSFAEFPPNAAPLAVAAHTHGGQIRIPFLPSWSWLELVSEDEIHADGWIEGYGQAGNRLYVNRGIGFSKLPVRINCSPEITLIKLHRTK